jgi:hypothetical protein
VTARNLTTCHHSPWTLVRRAGDTEGKRPSTRMAYLTGTICEHGLAVAFCGYIMNNNMEGWTKSNRRVEFDEIIRQWRAQPTTAQIQKIKRAMPKVTAEDIAKQDFSRRIVPGALPCDPARSVYRERAVS